VVNRKWLLFEKRKKDSMPSLENEVKEGGGQVEGRWGQVGVDRRSVEG